MYVPSLQRQKVYLPFNHYPQMITFLETFSIFLSCSMASSNQLQVRKSDLQRKIGILPILVIEKFQNWGTTQTMSVLSVKPKNVEEVQRVVKAAKEYISEGKPCSIRCVGDGHSWSPLFVDENNILMYTSQLTLDNGKRICLNEVCVTYYQNLN